MWRKRKNSRLPNIYLHCGITLLVIHPEIAWAGIIWYPIVCVLFNILTLHNTIYLVARELKSLNTSFRSSLEFHTLPGFQVCGNKNYTLSANVSKNDNKPCYKLLLPLIKPYRVYLTNRTEVFVTLLDFPLTMNVYCLSWCSLSNFPCVTLTRGS